MLEDMEREFGISCSSAPVREHFPGDMMESQDEVERQQSLVGPGAEERKVGHQEMRQIHIDHKLYTCKCFSLLELTR